MIRQPKRTIGVGAVNISALEKKYVNQVLDNNRLSHGYFSQQLEKTFARAHQVKYALFSNSGTSSLQVGVHALKIKYNWQDGDEILVPAITFVASVNVILQNGLKPVLVDVEPDHYDIDPAKIEEKITDRTVAIMPVHLCGNPCRMEPIMKIKEKYNLKMIEDSCETMFAKVNDRPVGSFGEISCFSTYAAHVLVTGVGGFSCTNDNELAVIMKSLLNHGRDGIYTYIDDTKRGSLRELFSIVSRRFNFIYEGYSYRATELEAALGLGQMRRYRTVIKKRKHNAKAITKGLQKLVKFLQLPTQRKGHEHIFMMYPIVVKEGVDRDDLILYLEKHGVETRALLPLTNQPVYIKRWGSIEDFYPVAKHLNRNAFYIACHPELTSSDIAYIHRIFYQYFGLDKLLTIKHQSQTTDNRVTNKSRKTKTPKLYPADDKGILLGN